MTWQPLPGQGRQGRQDRGPRPVAELIDRWARRLGAPGAGPLAAVFTAWEQAVGPAVAGHARPVALVDGALRVAVDDPGWATELRYLGADVVRRLDEVVGEGVVRRLEVVVRPRRHTPLIE